MTAIKKVIFNNPATIVYWNDNTKTVVKANKDDVFDPEFGLAMAITKKLTNNIHWKRLFLIVTTDDRGRVTKQPIGDEKTVAMLGVRTYYKAKENWYKEFCSWLPKVEEKKEEPKEVLIPEPVVLEPKDLIIEMFNSGCSIAKISKEVNISEYYVKKYIDAATSPKGNKNKAIRTLNAALRGQGKKRERRTYNVRTQIDFPDYLDRETCETILAELKEKFKDDRKASCLSEMQKHFDGACKREYIRTHYANGYDMYAIAKVIGSNAASVQRLWNSMQKGK